MDINMHCNTCDTEYTAMPGLEDTEQADGCSASLYIHNDTYYMDLLLGLL